MPTLNLIGEIVLYPTPGPMEIVTASMDATSQVGSLARLTTSRKTCLVCTDLPPNQTRKTSFGSFYRYSVSPGTYRATSFCDVDRFITVYFEVLRGERFAIYDGLENDFSLLPLPRCPVRLASENEVGASDFLRFWRRRHPR